MTRLLRTRGTKRSSRVLARTSSGPSMVPPRIALNPLLYRVVHGEIRRRLLRRFPYAVYFTLEGNEIVVLGLFHCARDPRSTMEALRGRG